MQTFLTNVWVTMASVWVLPLLSLGSPLSAWERQLRDFHVYPKTGSVSGVFLLTNTPEPYGLNASEARSICQHFGATLATKAQVAKAQKNSLEACRYGWIDEHIAVIPRIKTLQNCGKGQSGVLEWRKTVDTKFDAYCYNETEVKMRFVSFTVDPLETTETAHHLLPTNVNLLSSYSAIPSSSFSSTSSSSSPDNPHPSDQSPSTQAEGGHAVSSVTITISAVAALLLLTATVVGLKYHRKKKTWLQFSKKAKHSKDISAEELKTTGKQDMAAHQAESEINGNSNEATLTVVADTGMP